MIHGFTYAPSADAMQGKNAAVKFKKPDQEVGKSGVLRASTGRGVLAIDSDCLSSGHIDSDMRLG